MFHIKMARMMLIIIFLLRRQQRLERKSTQEVPAAKDSQFKKTLQCQHQLFSRRIHHRSACLIIPAVALLTKTQPWYFVVASNLRYHEISYRILSHLATFVVPTLSQKASALTIAVPERHLVSVWVWD